MDALIHETLIAVAIYSGLPLTGFIGFVRICRTLYRRKLADPPVLKLFFLFVNYGGLLQCLLMIAFRKWSGGAALGALYLVSVAPVMMAVFAYQLKQRRREDGVFRIMHRAAIGYYAALPAAFLCCAIAAQ